MKHLPRLLWLLAWSLWFWMGFRLHRELPRQLGPLLSQVPIQADERRQGFVGETPLVAIQPQFFTRSTRPKVFNAQTGAFVRELSFDGQVDFWLTSCRTHGVLFVRGHQSKNAGLSVVDVATGRSKSLSSMMALDVVTHPTRNWVAFRESAAPIDKPRALVVLDWATGAEVFLRPQGPEYVHLRPLCFLADADRLVIAVTSTADGNPPSTVLEVWRLTPAPRLEKTVRLSQSVSGSILASRNSRFAWHHVSAAGGVVGVYDIEDEKLLFETELWKGLRPPQFMRLGETKLSESGRTIMTQRGIAVLTDIDSGRALWKQDASQLPATPMQPPVLIVNDMFAVFETWDQSWTRGGLRDWNTTAVRDLDSAALRFRIWARDASVLECMSPDGSLGVSSTGHVHQLPFRVNYPLLTLCQTILALPLILLWLILRLPRRRAAQRRLAEAAP